MVRVLRGRKAEGLKGRPAGTGMVGRAIATKVRASCWLKTIEKLRGLARVSLLPLCYPEANNEAEIVVFTS